MVSPLTQVDTQGGINPYLQPYVETMLGATMQTLFDVDPVTGDVLGLRPYQPYSFNPEDYVAAMSPLQESAMQGIAALQSSPYLSDAMRSVQGVIGSINDFDRVGAGSVSADTIEAAQTAFKPTLETFQMGPFERIATPRSITEQGVLEPYMSPYMQKVVDVQQQQARRQAAIAQQALGAQAARAGAFGGSGAALQRAQANAELQRNLQNIQATGLQSAFQQAQQQFNAEQQARQQAAIANQQAGLTTDVQNLAAKLGVQQLGTQASLQTELANMNARQQAAVANQAAKLQAAGMNQTSALQAAIANQNAAMQGKQLAMQGATAMGNLGLAQTQSQASLLNAQLQAGAQQQAMNQRAVDMAVQSYNTAQQYPFMQLGFMQNMLGGLPVATSSRQEYGAAPSATSQLLGAGTALLGASMKNKGGSGNLLGGLTDTLNSAATNIGNVVSDVGSVFGFAKGGNVKQAPPPKKNKAPMGLQALALSKI